MNLVTLKNLSYHSLKMLNRFNIILLSDLPQLDDIASIYDDNIHIVQDVLIEIAQNENGGEVIDENDEWIEVIQGEMLWMEVKQPN